MSVRDAAQRAIQEPLKKPGIEKFCILEDGRSIVSVSSEDAVFFAKPDVQDKVIIENRHTSAFSIVSLAFKEGNKWRLNDGNTQISAIINDEDFIRKVDKNEVSFSKGGILVCEVHVVQKETKDGLRTEYFVSEL